ncbi:MAG: uroporphyrinogen decarboxylase family protein [Armatimonadota bacterium]
MTSRQRVLTTIAHREPDAVPFNLRPGPDILDWYHRHLGAGEFAEHFGHDIRYVSLDLPSCPADVPADQWIPSPNAEDIARVTAETRALQERGYAVCGRYACGVYEQAKDWLGDEATMLAPYEEPQTFRNILDRIVAWKCAIYGAYAAAGTDIVWIGDDLGTQRSLVMSPSQYREWYRPRHQAIVDHLRAIRGDVHIAFHCCGHVTPLIPDLIEIGIDILEAVQAETMDIAGLKREYGRDITFWGAIGAQSVLQGTPADVREGVRQTLRTMAPGGGYIAAPCHTLTEEVPWENILAFHEAIQAYRAYPHPGAP